MNMKRIYLLLTILFFSISASAQAPYTVLEYSDTPADGECVVFDAAEDEWEPGSCSPGGGGDITSVGDCNTGSCFNNSKFSNKITFEGASNDNFETILTTVDPTTDRTISLPNLGGTLLVEASIDTSSELAAILTDETGTGAACFGTSPTIATPTLTLSTTAPTSSGEIAYNATDDRIQVFDGAGVDEYYAGPHTAAGTEYTVDDAAPATPTGPTNLMERDDALSTVTPIEGDWLHFRGSAEGALWTQEFNSDAILADTANIDTNVGTVAGAVSGSEMQVDIVADGAGLATAANQLPDGHNVTVDNASGGSAVNIQDGGNTITVDGTVGISGTVTTTADTELPAAASLGDNTPNPSVPGVGSFSHVWNGLTWDRQVGDSTNGTIVNLGTNNDVQGTVAHDGIDSGNPVKTGTQATDYHPDSEDEQGRAEVAAADRADFAANRRGELVTAVNPMYTTLDNLADVYDDVTTTNVSQDIEVWAYRYCTVVFELDKANSPTDIEFDIEISADGTNFVKLMNGGLAVWLYDDQTVGSGGIERGYGFDVAANEMRVRVTATGTTSSATFTVANPFLYCRT